MFNGRLASSAPREYVSINLACFVYTAETIVVSLFRSIRDVHISCRHCNISCMAVVFRFFICFGSLLDIKAVVRAISTNLVVYASSLLEGNVMEKAAGGIHTLPVDPLCESLRTRSVTICRACFCTR